MANGADAASKLNRRLEKPNGRAVISATEHWA
jgi:hypothetical protein